MPCVGGDRFEPKLVSLFVDQKEATEGGGGRCVCVCVVEFQVQISSVF